MVPRLLIRATLIGALFVTPVVSAQSKFDPALVSAFATAPTDADRLAMIQAHPEIEEKPFQEALSITGNQIRTRGDLAGAMQMYEALLFVGRHAKAAGPQAVALNNMGIVAGVRADFVGARRFLEDAMRIAEAAGDIKTIQSTWGNLGIVQRHEGDLDGAERSGQRGLQLAEQIGEKPLIGRALNNLGSVYSAAGDGERALDIYRRSLAMKEEIGDPGDIATTLVNIGGLYDEQGDYPQALQYYERALAAVTAADSPPAATMSALNNIGHLYIEIGENAKARATYGQALKSAEASNSPLQMATVLYNLGTLERNEGKLAEAERLQRRAFELREQTGDRAAIVESLTEIANLLNKGSRLQEALPLITRAVALAAESRLLNQLWKAQLSEAALHHEMGDDAAAQTSYQSAIATIERLRQSTGGGEAARRQYLAERVGPYYGLASLHAAGGRTADALAVVEQSRARALIDLVAGGRQPPTRHLTEAQQQRERELTQRVVTLSESVEAEARKPKPDAERLARLEDGRERARVIRDDFTAELYAEQPGLGLARGTFSQIGRAALGGLVEKQTTVATFVLDESSAWVYAVAAGSDGPVVTARRLSKTTGELQRSAEAFAKQLATRDLSFAAAARQLYADLLGPVDAIVAGGKDLIVVPDGPLWQVPFQALISPRGKFVVEERAVSYAPSLSALAAIESRRRDRGAREPFLLALGNPTTAAPAGALRSADSGGLPEAAREVQALGKLYGPDRSEVLTEGKASESALRADVARASVLHIATHGVLDDRNPMYSHLRLAPGTAERPDHLSDGRLEAWELLNLDLNADLAVFSACETARGSYGWGEGLIGLSWALVAAGASTAVVSQWPVDSASTTKLMIGFHERLLKSGDSPAGALRAAAMNVMKDPSYRHPFYWAGFIAIGAK